MKFLLFGILQGLTEFLPVSSSGHLYLLKRIIGEQANLFAFFILLHAATLAATIIFFFKQIISLCAKKRLLLQIAVITAVTGTMGLAIKHFFEPWFDKKILLSGCILTNALILFSARPTNDSPKKTAETMTVKDSLLIGLMQGISAFPGISRSGSTITAFLRRGFAPQEAFTLSFVASIPVILAAFILEIKELPNLTVHTGTKGIIAGCLAAAATGLLALIVLKRLVVNARFKNFSYYCFTLFIISLFL
ncbi:MAG: undecaprenyl-diphosphate phosphatase [Candidatus Omnitrophota bacterium]